MQKFKTALKQGLVVLTLMIVSLSTVVSTASAQLISPSDSPRSVAGATGGQSSLRELAKTIIDYFLSFLGFIAVIMIIYAGVLYVTSQGNDDKVGEAKKIITYALIGIIIIFLSFAIVNTVLGAASGAATTQ